MDNGWGICFDGLGFGVWCWYLRSKREVLFLVVNVSVYVVIGYVFGSVCFFGS